MLHGVIYAQRMHRTRTLKRLPSRLHNYVLCTRLYVSSPKNGQRMRLSKEDASPVI